MPLPGACLQKNIGQYTSEGDAPLQGSRWVMRPQLIIMGYCKNLPALRSAQFMKAESDHAVTGVPVTPAMIRINILQGN